MNHDDSDDDDERYALCDSEDEHNVFEADDRQRQYKRFLKEKAKEEAD